MKFYSFTILLHGSVWRTNKPLGIPYEWQLDIWQVLVSTVAVLALTSHSSHYSDGETEANWVLVWSLLTHWASQSSTHRLRYFTHKYFVTPQHHTSHITAKLTNTHNTWQRDIFYHAHWTSSLFELNSASRLQPWWWQVEPVWVLGKVCPLYK